VSVSPGATLPVIAGAVVGTGAPSVGGRTISVGAEEAVRLPELLSAVTASLTVAPASSGRTA
jgi:hypothetical protein